jgi:transposase-like protein
VPGTSPSPDRARSIAASRHSGGSPLLTQMYERGICPEYGLRLFIVDGVAAFKTARKTVYWDVPVQRCVFHKLGNIRRDLGVP